MAKRPFKALIVGGSVAGLTLAHAFDKANIDYVLLESRDTMAPQLGASIVIMPNGNRILEQLGVYDAVRDLSESMGLVSTWRSDGTFVSEANSAKMIEARLGYPGNICQRQKIIKVLFDMLRNKQNIVVNKHVVSVDNLPDSVAVKCNDSTEYIGDIVVGADGIHSKIRKEMQRHADKTGPPGLMDKDKSSITAEYSCFFGISTPLPWLKPGRHNIATDVDHSSLLFVGKDSHPLWFFTSKLDRKYPEKEIPRYTKAEMEEEALKYKDWHFTENTPMKTLFENAKSVSYVPLEEATHDVWSYGRLVCLGDSIHKMTPNMGQGGNQAIESAAVLSNCLVEMLGRHSSSRPTTGDIEEALTKYQKVRQKRARGIVKLSAAVTRREAHATLRDTLEFLYMKPWSAEFLADFQVGMYGTAPYIDWLPLPERSVGENMEWYIREPKTGEEKSIRSRL